MLDIFRESFRAATAHARNAIIFLLWSEEETLES